MSEPAAEIVIPDRPVFKTAEVCDLLKLQPYVLRTWENEFKDLGVEKTPGGPRVYRRHDVERAVRIRQLVFGEGLTLAGARRRLEAERPAEPDEAELALAESGGAGPPGLGAEARERLASVRTGLRNLLEQLSRPVGTAAAAPAAEDAPAGAKTPPAQRSSNPTTSLAGVAAAAVPPGEPVVTPARATVPVAAGVVPPLPFEAGELAAEPDLTRAGPVAREGGTAAVEATTKTPRRRKKSTAV